MVELGRVDGSKSQGINHTFAPRLILPSQTQWNRKNTYRLISVTAAQRVGWGCNLQLLFYLLKMETSFQKK